MKIKTTNSKMISFRLPNNYINMLEELAAYTGRPKSEHLRNGIEVLHRQTIKQKKVACVVE